MLAIQLVAIRLQKRLLDDVWPGDMEITFQVQRIWYGHHWHTAASPIVDVHAHFPEAIFIYSLRPGENFLNYK